MAGNTDKSMFKNKNKYNITVMIMHFWCTDGDIPLHCFGLTLACLKR